MFTCVYLFHRQRRFSFGLEVVGCWSLRYHTCGEVGLAAILMCLYWVCILIPMWSECLISYITRIHIGSPWLLWVQYLADMCNFVVFYTVLLPCTFCLLVYGTWSLYCAEMGQVCRRHSTCDSSFIVDKSHLIVFMVKTIWWDLREWSEATV